MKLSILTNPDISLEDSLVLLFPVTTSISQFNTCLNPNQIRFFKKMLLLFASFCKNLDAFQAIRPLIFRELMSLVDFTESHVLRVLMNRNAYTYQKGAT